MPVSILPAERIRRLPPYLFAEIDRMKKEVAARGVDLISLGIGDPDSPTFPHIVTALAGSGDPSGQPSLPRLRGHADVPRGGGGVSREALRRPLRSRHRSRVADRLQGGHRQHGGCLRRPGRHRARPRPRLSGLRHRDHLQRRHRLPDAAAGRKRLPPRPEGHPGRDREAGEAHVDRLPQQPDGGARHERVLRRRSSRSPSTTTSSSPTTTPTPRSTSTRRRRAFSRPPAPAISASSSTRSPRPTT